MKFYYNYSHSEMFAVLTADQFVGRGDGLLKNRSRIAITTKATKSKELSIRNRILDM